MLYDNRCLATFIDKFVLTQNVAYLFRCKLSTSRWAVSWHSAVMSMDRQNQAPGNQTTAGLPAQHPPLRLLLCLLREPRNSSSKPARLRRSLEHLQLRDATCLEMCVHVGALSESHCCHVVCGIHVTGHTAVLYTCDCGLRHNPTLLCAEIMFIKHAYIHIIWYGVHLA